MAQSFQVAGRKGATLSLLESKAIEQGGDGGYSESGRRHLSAITKSLQEALKDIPDDANLAISGTFEESGQALNINIQISANHPQLNVAPSKDANEADPDRANVGVAGDNMGSAPATTSDPNV